jgi:hypothetical protein
MVAQEALDLRELAFAPHEAGQRCGYVVSFLSRTNDLDLLTKDGTFELGQVFARLQPKLPEDTARLSIRREGIGLSTAAVERNYELLPQALAQGFLFDELLELGDEPIVATKREIRFDSVLETDEAKFLQPFGLENESLAGGHVGQRRSPPQCQCRAKSFGCYARRSAGERLFPLAQQPFESFNVYAIG